MAERGDIPATVAGLFLAAARRFPGRPWIRKLDRGAERRLTFADGGRRVAAVALRLHELGLTRGDRLLLWSDDMYSSIVLDIACACTGIVLVPVSPRFSASFVARIARRVVAVAVAGEPPRLAELDALAGVCKTIGVGVSPPGCDVIDVDGTLDLTTEASAAWLTTAARAVEPDDPCTILQTSGTTGEPKLVVRSHRNWVRYAQFGRFDLRAGVGPQRRVLMVAPLTHSMGLHVLTTGLSLAAELCVPSAIDTAMPLGDLHALDPDYMVMTPRVLRGLDHARRTQARPLFGPSVDILLVAGAPVESSLLRAAIEHGASLGEYYAGSEMSLVALTPRGQWREGHVGKILPDVDLRLAADGEILVRSPGAMLGYWGDADLTSAAYTTDGFYRTGDIGEVSGDAWLRLVGRKRDVFNTFEGSNVSPGRIESMVDALPWVRHSLLLGDQRPFLSVLIVVDEPRAGGTSCIDPAARPELYRLARRALGEINCALEPIERVARFVLLARPFGQDVLQTVAAGKLRRDRDAAQRVYADEIARVYRSDCPVPYRVLGVAEEASSA